MRPAASMTTWRGLVLCALALAVVLVAWASTDTAPLMTTTAPSTRPQPSAAPTVLLPSLWAQALVVMVVLVAGLPVWWPGGLCVSSSHTCRVSSRLPLTRRPRDAVLTSPS